MKLTKDSINAVLESKLDDIKSDIRKEIKSSMALQEAKRPLEISISHGYFVFDYGQTAYILKYDKSNKEWELGSNRKNLSGSVTQWKYFKSLEDLEKKIKGLKGISLMIPKDGDLKKLKESTFDTQEDNGDADVFLNEDTGEQYYIELDEETLEEQKIVIRVTSKGERLRKVRCGNGRVARKVNGKTICVTPTGREKITKKLAIKQSVRSKKARGSGYKKRVNFKRQRAIKKRRAMGL